MVSSVGFTGSQYLIVKDKKNRVIPCLSHEIKENPNRPDDPDVVICQGKDPKTGETIDQTLPLSKVKKMHKIMSNKILATLVPLVVWGSIPAADMYSRSVGQSAWNEPEPVEYRINTLEEAMQEVQLSDDMKDCLPQIGEQGERFIKSLAENKQSLMKDLNLSSQEYDDMADISLKISKNETQFGESYKYRGMLLAESYYIGAAAASKYREQTNSDGDATLSRGMTQYKIAYATDEEKALFDKYGVTYDNLTTNIEYPEKSAIATMIHLGTLKKGYDDYVKQMKAKAPDINNDTVRASMERAQEILFDSDVRPNAIKALTQINDSDAEAEYLEKAGITSEDLDALRTYAKGIILSQKGYVAAGWNAKNINPYGDKADIGCANLLNAAAGVGYIGNITDDASLPI